MIIHKGIVGISVVGVGITIAVLSISKNKSITTPITCPDGHYSTSLESCKNN